MGCCGKAKKGILKVKNIVHGLGSHAVEKITNIQIAKCKSTAARVRICQKCEHNKWIGKTLWCSICNCFVPGKARVESEVCPKDLW